MAVSRSRRHLTSTPRSQGCTSHTVRICSTPTKLDIHRTYAPPFGGTDVSNQYTLAGTCGAVGMLNGWSPDGLYFVAGSATTPFVEIVSVVAVVLPKMI